MLALIRVVAVARLDVKAITIYSRVNASEQRSHSGNEGSVYCPYVEILCEILSKFISSFWPSVHKSWYLK
jgi:hypothetical protein